jgi:ribosome-associated protein
MGDTVHNSKQDAMAIASLLADHRGGDVVVLDLATQAGWTDYFVIATATSSTHMRGLARFVDEYADQERLQRLNRPRVADDDEWILVDLVTVVVHIMTENSRSFYELEKLWFQSEAVHVAASAALSAKPEASFAS